MLALLALFPKHAFLICCSDLNERINFKKYLKLIFEDLVLP